MVSVIIITKNEEQMIEDCLNSVSFADEIIVVDTGNTDKTNEISKNHGCKVVKSSGEDYSQWRNDGLKYASHEWILFVDADERVSDQLAKEILNVSEPAAYLVPRKNNYLGKFMNYGGWGGEKLIRFFHRSKIHEYHGQLHEQRIIEGRLKELSGSLLHFSHRDLSSMVTKTILFTHYEAKIRKDLQHPPIVAWRLVRVMLTEFYVRFVKHKAFLDGSRGVIDGLFQIFNSFIIYSRLWEMQNESKKSVRT